MLNNNFILRAEDPRFKKFVCKFLSGGRTDQPHYVRLGWGGLSPHQIALHFHRKCKALTHGESGSSVVELIMVMVLIIIFAVLGAAFTQSAAAAGKSIAANNTAQADARIAISYVNVRLRMNDAAGRIEIVPLERTGRDAIVIRHRTSGADIDRWIYFEDGALLEALTDPGMMPEPLLSTVIARLDNFEVAFDEERGRLFLTIEYELNNEIQRITSTMAFRSSE